MISKATGLTEQQRRAVEERSVSVVLSSGAGCGKTHVLTARYLSHLIQDGVDVSQVVAITFTDRAAREMRGRIRQSIEQQMRAAPDTDRERWEGYLRGLETAPICTIHSFCGNLLRQFAVTVRIDPSFEVLEDVLAANLRQESLAETLQGLLTSQSSLGEDLRQLVILYGWRAVNTGIEELLREADISRWQQWLILDPETIQQTWQQEQRQALLPKYLAYLLCGSPSIAGSLNLLRSVRLVPSSDPKIRKRYEEIQTILQRILMETAQLGSSPNWKNHLEELTNQAYLGRGANAVFADEATYERVQTAIKKYREDLPKRLHLFLEEPEQVLEEVINGQRFLRIALAVVQNYQDRKRRSAVMDFQDLLIQARNLLRDQEEVREQLRQRYAFLLLDELQDTDPVQMELVELLCGVGFYEGKLFAVGDHKQSIYRFRGADVRLFQSLRQSVQSQGQLTLNRNYRSQPGIIDFVNALFSLRVTDYEALEAHLPQINTSTNVEFLWSIPDEEMEKESAADLRKREAEMIAETIVQMLRSEDKIIWDSKQNSLRPVEAKDIVLLFRSMSQVAIYESALRQAGLDYYLVGGRAFFAQQEVYDLLNLLRCLENPEDSLSLAGTLRSPFCCLSDEALALLSQCTDGLWVGLQEDVWIVSLPEVQHQTVKRARRFLNRWRSLKDRLSIVQLLQVILEDSGYDAALQFEFLGDRKLANLWKLMHLARSFGRTSLFSLADFIARLGDMVNNQPREEQAATQPENADVIKLMSIHQSKGLEFPVVILPDLNASTRGEHTAVVRWHREYGCLVKPPTEDDPPLFSDFGWLLGKTADAMEEWHEDLRILYVACTRAKDRLILSAALAKPLPMDTPANQTVPVDSPNAWMLALGERFHILSGQCLAIDISPTTQAKVTIVKPTIKEFQPHVATKLDKAPPQSFQKMVPSCLGLETLSLPALERLLWWDTLPSTNPSLFESNSDPSLRSRLLTPPTASSASIRERLGAYDDSPLSRKERMFRHVLSRWNLIDPHAWPTILSEATEAETSAALAVRWAEELAPLFQTLAQSEVREQLLQAKDRLTDVEFLLDGATVFQKLDLPTRKNQVPLPVIQGIIDWLWQDESGHWHLLAIDQGGKEAPSEPWLGRKSILQIQAWAVREFPLPLRTITHYDLCEDRIETLDARRVKFAPAFRWLEQQWERLMNPIGE